MRSVGILLYKTRKGVLFVLLLVHINQLILVGVCVLSIGLAQVFIVVVEHTPLSILGPVLFIQWLNLFILIVKVFVFYLNVNFFVVILSFGIVSLAVNEG